MSDNTKMNWEEETAQIITKLGRRKLPKHPSLFGLLSAINKDARKQKPIKRRYRRG